MDMMWRFGWTVRRSKPRRCWVFPSIGMADMTNHWLLQEGSLADYANPPERQVKDLPAIPGTVNSPELQLQEEEPPGPTPAEESEESRQVGLFSVRTSRSVLQPPYARRILPWPRPIASWSPCPTLVQSQAGTRKHWLGCSAMYKLLWLEYMRMEDPALSPSRREELVLSEFAADYFETMLDAGGFPIAESSGCSGRYPKQWDLPCWRRVLARSDVDFVEFRMCSFGLGPPDEPGAFYQHLTRVVFPKHEPLRVALSRRCPGVSATHRHVALKGARPGSTCHPLHGGWRLLPGVRADCLRGSSSISFCGGGWSLFEAWGQVWRASRRWTVSWRSRTRGYRGWEGRGCAKGEECRGCRGRRRYRGRERGCRRCRGCRRYRGRRGTRPSRRRRKCRPWRMLLPGRKRGEWGWRLGDWSKFRVY